MPASISSKTSVSPPATAAIASAMRDSSPPEAVSATGANGRPGFGRMRKRTSSAPVGPSSRSPSSAANSPSPMPTLASSPATASANGAAASRRACESSATRSRTFASAAASASDAAADGVDAVGERVELGARLGRTREQLLERRAAEAALGVGDPLELGLDLLEPAGLGLERRQERAQLERRLAQAQLDVAQLVAAPRASSGASDSSGATARSARADEPAGAVALVGRERVDRRADALGELGHVPQPLALARGASSSVPGSSPLVSSTSARSSSSARLGLRGVGGELLVPSPRGE